VVAEGEGEVGELAVVGDVAVDGEVVAGAEGEVEEELGDESGAEIAPQRSTLARIKSLEGIRCGSIVVDSGDAYASPHLFRAAGLGSHQLAIKKQSICMH